MPTSGHVTGPLVGDPVRAPDSFATEPVVGFRAWNVIEVDGHVALQSVTYTEVRWPKGRALIAECMKRIGPEERGCSCAPMLACCCGIYIRREAEALREWATAKWNGGAAVPGSVPMRVWGTASGWGRVVQHDHGWRVGLAYPREIFVPEPLSRLAAILDDQYSIAATVEAL